MSAKVYAKEMNHSECKKSDTFHYSEYANLLLAFAFDAGVCVLG